MGYTAWLAIYRLNATSIYPIVYRTCPLVRRKRWSIHVPLRQLAGNVTRLLNLLYLLKRLWRGIFIIQCGPVLYLTRPIQIRKNVDNSLWSAISLSFPRVWFLSQNFIAFYHFCGIRQGWLYMVTFPSVWTGFSAQRVSNVEFWRFLFYKYV